MGDDALGIYVARQLQERVPPNVDVVFAPVSGFALLDYVTGAEELIAVDTIHVPDAVPGRVGVFRWDDASDLPTAAPHGVGLLEVLHLSQQLGLNVSKSVSFVTVETGAVDEFGADPSAAIRGAIPAVCRAVLALLPTRT